MNLKLSKQKQESLVFDKDKLLIVIAKLFFACVKSITVPLFSLAVTFVTSLTISNKNIRLFILRSCTISIIEFLAFL